ncbi:hypothetical protein JCM9957A_06220 [Kineosporia succinea]
MPGAPDARRPGVSGDDNGGRRPGPDLRGIARAVEDLVHAVAPDVVTSVEIELREPARPGRSTNGARRWASPGDEPGDASPTRTTALAPVPTAATTTSSSRTESRTEGRAESRAGNRPAGGEPGRPAEPFDVDITRRTLELDGDPVELTRREFDLLAFLERHRGQALGRDELMRAVWHTGYISGDRTIDVHVRRLRVKLGRHADRLVTLRGYGYRLD